MPLIAAAGDRIDLLVTRQQPEGEGVEAGVEEEQSAPATSTASSVPWIDETDQESTLS